MVGESAARGARVVCAGGCVVDRKVIFTDQPIAATSNAARAVTSFGGVARNVAENLARLGTPTAMVSRVGDDDSGRALTTYLAELGVDVEPVSVAPSVETAQYLALLDPIGDLIVAAAAMDVLDGLAPADLDRAWPTEKVIGGGVHWVFADCNLPIDTLAHAVRRAERDGTRLAVDAVSAKRIVKLPRDLTGVSVLFCNEYEAQALVAHHGWVNPNNLDLAQLLREHGAEKVVLTRGSEGVIIADAEGTRMQPVIAASVHDITGAGDAMIAGTLALLVTGAGLDDAVLAGELVGALTVESQYAVRPDLSADLVDEASVHRLHRPGIISAARADAASA